MTRVLGAVLAGGRASRFGSDKALALLDGKPLIAHVLDALAPQTQALLVCGREWAGLPWVPDRPGPGLGPLGGINAALQYARANGFGFVLTAGCDTPRLPPDLERRLRVADGSAYLEALPVIGRWQARLAPVLDGHLAEGSDRSVRRWAGAIGAVPIRLDEALPNINRKLDLDQVSGLRI